MKRQGTKQKRDRQAEREKERILDPEKPAREKKRARKRRLLAAAGALLFLLAAGCGVLAAVRAAGKAGLQEKAVTRAPDLSVSGKTEPAPEEEAWQEGQVRYQGRTYRYNEDILTFLLMGIDKDAGAAEAAEGTDGGQADALFLAVANPHKKAVDVIAVNRNTMTDIDVYNGEGAYVTTVTAQIAVQHGFGNGMEESCGYQKKAVARLFYNLPIHGYAAVNMSAIAAANDAVGGVDVEVLEDLTAADASLKKGETVHLTGESAFWYVKYRDVNAYGSADRRLERQKQYLSAFIQEAKKAVKEDISAVAGLYQAVAPMMVTDVTLDEAVYLAPVLAGYRFDMDSLHTLEGETVQGEQFEEFYVDEDALYELILEIFYEEVETDGQDR